MRLVILGASGFVGGAIARAALAAGHDVVGIAREGSPTPEGVERAVASPFDPNALARALEGADVAVHALGTTDPTLPPGIYRWLSVATSENLIAAAKHVGVPRLVAISCADVVLSAQDRVHWDEKRDLSGEPLGARARAIRLAEEVTLASGDETTSTVALRPGWVWGAGDRSRLPSLLREARAGGIAMIGEGRNLLSTTHVDLVARAALAAARFPGAAGQTYYLTDGELLELREVLGGICRALDLPPPRTGVPGIGAWWSRRFGGLPPEVIAERAHSTHFNAEKARTELGIESVVTLEDGLKELASWARSEGIDALAAYTRPRPTLEAIEAEVREAEARSRGD